MQGGGHVTCSASLAEPPFSHVDVCALSPSRKRFDQAGVQPAPESIDRQSAPGAADRQVVWQTAAWR